MADFKNIVSQIIYFEGGKSTDKRDTASKNPAPNTGGVHTNKGITWTTFVALAPKLGYAPTIENFLIMPESIWYKIYKEGFWNYLYLDGLNSQAIANLIVQMAWGSGRDTAPKQLSNWLKELGINLPSTRSKETIEILNRAASSKAKEQNIFLHLWNKRMAFLQSLRNWNTYKNGWSKRMNVLKDTGLALINKKKSLILLALLPILLLMLQAKKKN